MCLKYFETDQKQRMLLEFLIFYQYTEVSIKKKLILF